MKLVVEIEGSSALHRVIEMTIAEFEALQPVGLRGIPAFVATGRSGEILLWPKPISECNVYQLVPQVHAS